MAYRLLVLPIAGLLLGLACEAYIGLVAPGAEVPAIACCLAGLALSALWRLGGRSLAIATAALGAASAALVVHLGRLNGSLGTSEVSAAARHPSPPLLALIAFSAVCIAVLYGWLVVDRRQPWPAVALAGGAVLMRADVSAVYADRFPLFMAGALLLVLYTYAPTARELWSSFPSGGAALLAVLLVWQIPTVVPSWSAGLVDPLASAVGFQSGGATSTLSLSGPFHGSDQVVMTIRLSRFEPAPYWRRSVFDSYDGRSWTQSESLEEDVPAGKPLLALRGATSTTIAQVTLRTPSEELVSPGIPARASVDGRVILGPDTRSLMAVRTNHPLAPGTRYLISATPLSSLTPTNSSAAYLQLPPLTERVTALARRLTAASSTDWGKIRALATYLRDSGRFRYDSGVGSDPGQEAVDNFLFRTRRGYCNQFATALSVMARAIGIPSRVVVGYASGVYHQGSFLVRARDAHSWVEVNVAGSGWTGVDPTPGFVGPGSGSNYPPLESRSRAHQSALGPDGTITRSKIPFSRVAASSPSALPPARRILPRRHGGGWPPISLLSAGLVLLVALVTIVTLLRPRSIRQIYAALAGGRAGSPGRIRPSETPFEFGRRLTVGRPANADLQLITELYVRDRYGGLAPRPEEVAAARKAWRRFWRPRAFRP